MLANHRDELRHCLGEDLLIASGRTHKEDMGSWKPNAVVFSLESGEQEGTFCIGDDIDYV